MKANTTTIPTASEPRKSGLTFAQEVRIRREVKAAAREQRLQEHAGYQARYRHETLRQKVRRLATSTRGLEYDAIRREVEAYLPLANPTPARRRRLRECIARLVNRYRRVERRGWLH